MTAVTDVESFPTDPSLLPSAAVVAIDGPAGSGKSTTAKALAQRYRLLYIDTGAMYRALTWAALTEGIDPADGDNLASLLENARLELTPAKGDVTVHWNGRDVSSEIRTPEVEATVSLVSSHPSVRRNMVRRQQAMGRQGGVVMEGRDIGSVVLPLATAKIFLSASLEARADRRFKQYQQRGRKLSRDEITRDLAERDRKDSEREASPLMIPPDAIVIDSSAMSLDQQNEACARACLVNPALDREMITDLEEARLEIPWHYRLAYAVMKGLARFYGLRQVGNEGRALPRGCLVAANHISMWDPPLIGSTFFRFPVHTLAKAELFRPWFIGAIFRGLDVIPINRRGYDTRAFASASKALAQGHNLFIFPEGTRKAIGHPGPVKSGLGILVQATRAPLQPIFIRGSHGRLPGGSRKSPLEVHYGPVIRWHGLEALLETQDKKIVSKRLGDFCQAIFRELQDRSFAENPQTDFERELGERQLVKYKVREKRIFRS
jgi:cytidylate kinase